MYVKCSTKILWFARQHCHSKTEYDLLQISQVKILNNKVKKNLKQVNDQMNCLESITNKTNIKHF